MNILLYYFNKSFCKKNVGACDINPIEVIGKHLFGSHDDKVRGQPGNEKYVCTDYLRYINNSNH